MSDKKDFVIRARCSPAIKKAVGAYIDAQNNNDDLRAIDESFVIRKALRDFLEANISNLSPADREKVHECLDADRIWRHQKKQRRATSSHRK